ncbi:hypothetical protein Q7P37_007095 [Cladosporium fusiforme]
MPFFKRMSDTFWSYLSPHKTVSQPPTPRTAPPVFRKSARPARPGSLRQLKQLSRSMSPNSRVDSWRATGSPSPSGKRRTAEPNNSGTGSRKMRKLDDGRGLRDEVALFEGEEEDEDISDPEEDEDISDEDQVMKDDDGLSSMLSGVRVEGTPTPEDFLDEYDSEVDVDTTEVLNDGDYHLTPHRRKIAPLPEEQEVFGVSSADMRAAGWDDDYITLFQKIKLRGHEPLMPQRWRFSLRSMPDALFAATDDAYIGSICNQHFRAEKALEKLMELGAQVRDSIAVASQTRPEALVRRNVEAYQRWASVDADFDPHSSISPLILETKPADTPATVIHENVNRKLARLAARYRSAFRVMQSTEASPGSSTSTQYSYPVPTLYALVASHALVAMMAYRPNDPEPDAKPIAFFDMSDSNYDVWNALAVAILVCHARDVQVTVADDTGLGMKVANDGREAVNDDPDL